MSLATALRRQPVRLYLYGVLVPGEALAVSYGLLSDNQGALWLALGAAVLVVPGVEFARANVTPIDDPRDDAGRQLVPLRPGVDGLPPPYEYGSH